MHEIDDPRMIIPKNRENIFDQTTKQPLSNFEH